MIFENSVSEILEKGHVKSMRTPRRACIKRFMKMDEAKQVCRDRSVWRSVLITPLGIKREVRYNIYIILININEKQ